MSEQRRPDVRTHTISPEGHTLTTEHDDPSGLVVVWLGLNGERIGAAQAVDPHDRSAVPQLIAHLNTLLPPQSSSEGVHYLALKTYALLALAPDPAAPPRRGVPRRSAPLWLAVALGLLVGLVLVYLVHVTGLL